MAEVASYSKAKRHKAREAPHWFSDLDFTWRGVHDRRTGRFVTATELTPVELAKFLSYFAVVAAQGAAQRLQSAKRPRVYFAPERPPPWYIVWSAMTLSGCRFAKSRAEADVVFYFEDKTRASVALDHHALNGACTDISKSRVARVFEEVAGYPLALDPQTHEGLAVEKSEENGAHDGRLLRCPRAPAPGKTYQRFIESGDDERAVDLRTAVIGRKPVYVLRKIKPADERFSIHNKKVVYREVSDIFSADEIALLTRFAEAMQLDWGALDVLRDRVSGRLYVVDVNKTDTGPAVDLSWGDRAKLKRRIASAFLAMLRARAQGRR